MHPYPNVASMRTFTRRHLLRQRRSLLASILLEEIRRRATNQYFTNEAPARDKWGQHCWGHCNFYVFGQRYFLVLPSNLS